MGNFAENLNLGNLRPPLVFRFSFENICVSYKNKQTNKQTNKQNFKQTKLRLTNKLYFVFLKAYADYFLISKTHSKLGL